MKWEKLGRVFHVDKAINGFVSHAQVPVVDTEDPDGVCVYFSTRDEQHRSHPVRVWLDPIDLTKVIRRDFEPILALGALGTFDDCGVMPSWLVNHAGKKYLYYIGWNVRNTIPYHNAVGLAISEDGGKTFKRISEGPLWDRDLNEPHYSGTSCVLLEDGKWRNWYLSCTEWKRIHDRSEPRYHIKLATSNDGIHWKRDGIVAIDYQDEEEGGIVKASVIKEAQGYHMWYAHRKWEGYRVDVNASYRIGYARSSDGIHWERKDKDAGIDVSASGWDSEMISYPHVFDFKGERYMLYNGNGFGREGFGLAILRHE